MSSPVSSIEMERWSQLEEEPLLEESGANGNENHAAIAIHSDRPVFETRETYCAPGVKGILASYYVALCAFFVCLGGLLFGYDQGVISILLVEPQFLQRFPIVGDDNVSSGFWKGLLTAMIELGALLGAFNQGWIADEISRKYSIGVAVCIFILGSALQTCAVDYSGLILARLIGGVGIGMLSMVAPLYISEISPPEIRGTLLVLEQLSIVSGAVAAFWITYATRYIESEWAWRLPFLLQIFPGLLLGAGIAFLPFSPRWLASKGRDQDALRSLAKLRQLPETDRRVKLEWFDIRAEVSLHHEISAERHPSLQLGTFSNRVRLELACWMDLFKRGCWRRTQVGVGIMFFQQLIGVNAVIYYAPTMLKYLDLDYDTTLVMSGVINIAQLVGVITSIWSMDRIGRRGLLLIGSFLTFICHFTLATLVARYSKDWSHHRNEGWACVALLLFYMISFGATWGPVPWAIPSEIFPSSLRAKGVAISTCSNWQANFIVGLITPPLVQNTGHGAYVFFAVFCFLSGVWAFFTVPETSGKTLEQMDHVFGDVSSEVEKQRRERIEKRIAASIYETSTTQ